jgi:hypothetical protein
MEMEMPFRLLDVRLLAGPALSEKELRSNQVRKARPWPPAASAFQRAQSTKQRQQPKAQQAASSRWQVALAPAPGTGTENPSGVRSAAESPFELNKPDYLLWGCFRSSFASSSTPAGCLLQLRQAWPG